MISETEHGVWRTGVRFYVRGGTPDPGMTVSHSILHECSVAHLQCLGNEVKNLPNRPKAGVVHWSQEGNKEEVRVSREIVGQKVQERDTVVSGVSFHPCRGEKLCKFDFG